MQDFLIMVRRLMGAACVLTVAACGNGGTASQGGLVSCRAPDADRPTCIEDEPYNDDMRLVAVSKCREAGGKVGTACPRNDLAGSCETVNTATFENRKAWEFSRRRRTYYYAVPGAAAAAPDVSVLKKECEQQGPGYAGGQWVDANPAS
jgi:hypothetical protein